MCFRDTLQPSHPRKQNPSGGKWKPGLADGPHWADSSDKQLEEQTKHKREYTYSGKKEKKKSEYTLGPSSTIQEAEKQAVNYATQQCSYIKLALNY